MKLWELDSLRCELLSLGSLNLAIVDNSSSNDLDGLSSGTGTASQVQVQLRDSTSKAHISVFFVHVDGVCARQVFKNDSVVSDSSGLLLKNLDKKLVNRRFVTYLAG